MLNCSVLLNLLSSVATYNWSAQMKHKISINKIYKRLKNLTKRRIAKGDGVLRDRSLLEIKHTDSKIQLSIYRLHLKLLDLMPWWQWRIVAALQQSAWRTIFLHLERSSVSSVVCCKVIFLAARSSRTLSNHFFFDLPSAQLSCVLHAAVCEGICEPRDQDTTVCETPGLWQYHSQGKVPLICPHFFGNLVLLIHRSSRHLENS